MLPEFLRGLTKTPFSSGGTNLPTQDRPLTLVSLFAKLKQTLPFGGKKARKRPLRLRKLRNFPEAPLP